MGNDIELEIKEIIEQMRGFNIDPKIIDQRVKALVITKLEEALFWYSRIDPNKS